MTDAPKRSSPTITDKNLAIQTPWNPPEGRFLTFDCSSVLCRTVAHWQRTGSTLKPHCSCTSVAILCATEETTHCTGSALLCSTLLATLRVLSFLPYFFLDPSAAKIFAHAKMVTVSCLCSCFKKGEIIPEGKQMCYTLKCFWKWKEFLQKDILFGRSSAPILDFKCWLQVWKASMQFFFQAR